MRRLILAALAACTLSACGGGGDGGPRQYTTTYRVTAGALGTEASSAFVTYTNASGGTSQETITTPWSYQRTGVSAGQFLYVSAQRRATGSGVITATILADGAYIKTSTSSGEFVIASSSASCCTP